MIRLLLPVFAGIILGGIVHLVTLLAVPVVATKDAYARVAVLGPESRFLAVPREGANALPFLDPAFIHLVCRYDASLAPVALHVPVAGEYVSIAFHARDGVAYFSLNDRSALSGAIDAEIRSGAEEQDTPLGTNVILVTTPSPTGFVVLRAAVPHPSLEQVVRAQFEEARCEPTR